MAGNKGFTVIELMTAIAITAILAGIGGYSYFSGLSERRVVAACRDLYSAIEQTRSLAVSTCEKNSIVFNKKANTYTIENANGSPVKGPYSFAEGIEIFRVTGCGNDICTYTYNPRGMKTGVNSTVVIGYHKAGGIKMGVTVTSIGSISINDSID